MNALLTQFFGSTEPGQPGLGGELPPRLRRLRGRHAPAGWPRRRSSRRSPTRPPPTTVSALQSALRAQYAEPDWLTVISPINDTARIQQRDALVAYILQQLGDGYAQSADHPDHHRGRRHRRDHARAAPATRRRRGRHDRPGRRRRPGHHGDRGRPGGTPITLSAGHPGRAARRHALIFVPPNADRLRHPGQPATSTSSIDTQTQPPVLTSRIRLALSTVQLFIERVIRNLEPQVVRRPTSTPPQWEWMKRYRRLAGQPRGVPVAGELALPGAARRPVAVLPADDEQPAAGRHHRRRGRQRLPRLPHQPRGGRQARTVRPVLPAGHRRHRRDLLRRGAHRRGAPQVLLPRAARSARWTPWTQVKIDCEDMPVTPIVWNGRLFLFWLKAVKQSTAGASRAQHRRRAGARHRPRQPDGQRSATAPRPPRTSAAGQGSVTVQAVLCWTEYYNGKWQPTKTSDVNLPTTIGNFDPSGSGLVRGVPQPLRIVPGPVHGHEPGPDRHTPGQFSLPPDAARSWRSPVTGSTSPAAGFILHNTHSLPVRFDDMIVLAPIIGGRL